MKRFILFLFLICLSPITGQEQNSEIVKAPTGETLFRWFGQAGRSYFLQQSDPYDPLQSWYWAPIIEGGNDEDIDYEVDGNADKAFFRLKYTDQVPGPGETLETADFDHDGIPNINEINVYPPTDPLNPDTDGDTLLDGWERNHGLDPTDNGSINPDNGANGDPDQDGFTNAQEQTAGTDPGNPDSHPPGTPLPGGAPLLVGEQTTVSNHRWGFPGFQTPANRYLKSVSHVSSTETNNDDDGGESTTTILYNDLQTGVYSYDYTGGGGADYGITWTVNSDTSRNRDGTDDDGSGETSTATETLSVEYTIPAFVANVESWIPAYDGHFTVDKNTANIFLAPEASDPEPATDYAITKLKYKWQVNAGPNPVVSWLEVFTPADGTTPVVVSKSWTPSPTDTESPVYEIDPTTRNGKKNGVYSLLPVDLISDLNNDGKIDFADSRALSIAMSPGATEADTAKGVEYILQDNIMSNGAWDNQDQAGNICFDWPQYGNLEHAPADGEMDDDAIAIELKAPSSGVAWFTHEAIETLTFFTDKECLNPIAIDHDHPFDLSTHLSDRLWIKYRPNYSGINPGSSVDTVEGKLTLHIGKSTSEKWVTKNLPLTVVPDFGCKKFFEAARNYIFERNTQVFVWDYYMPDKFNPVQIFRLCVMREEATTVNAYDAFSTNKKGIEDVALAAGSNQPTVMVNGNQCFFRAGYDESSLTDLPFMAFTIADGCHGKVIIGGATSGISSNNYDTTTKPARGSDLAGPDPIPVGNIAGNDGILGNADDILNPNAGNPGGKFFSQTGSTWNFAAGQATGTDAVGGLSTNYASPIRSALSHQMIGRVPCSEPGKGCVFTATEIYGVGQAPAFVAAAKRSGNQMLSPSTDALAQELFILDSGGGSLALEHIDPAGNLQKAYIGRKSAVGVPYYVNDYIQFRATEPRP